MRPSYLQFAQPLMKLYESAPAPLTAKKKARNAKSGIQAKTL